MSSIPWKNGEVLGDRFVNGLDDHFPFWTKIQKLRPEFRNYEYDDIPRGRVIFDMEKKIFMVYLPSLFLNNKNVKEKIIACFNLPPDIIKWSTDEHYEKRD